MELKNNKERARMAINILYGMGVISVGVLISNLMQYNLLSQEYYSEAAATSNDTRQTIVSIAYLIFLFISAYFFINWFRRAYYNLHQLRGDLKYPESYAGWSWFIPIISLWYPYQVMKEIWIKTQLEINIEKVESHSLIGLWWTAWITTNTLSNITARFPGETIDELLTLTQLSLLDDIISLIALVMVIQIVKKISGYEEALFNGTHDMAIEDHLIE